MSFVSRRVTDLPDTNHVTSSVVCTQI